MNPYNVTKDFEKALCEYTGAPYAVAVNSGTAAIMLACQWHREEKFRYIWASSYADMVEKTSLEIPRKTYVSVPCAVIRSGWRTKWRDEDWRGEYQLKPLPVWDSACRFTSGMYRPDQFQCVSFAARKILGIEQGGAILHDNPEADKWFRRMRFDGRTEGLDPSEDTFDLVGHHCIMIPSVAAALLLQLYHLPKHNEDQVYEYPDLSKHPAFR